MKKVTIIAEAGVNHNGDINLAKKLIDAAANAGADYVKFQTFIASNLVSSDAKKADYQEANSNISDENQHQMLQRLELTKEDHLVLIQHCMDKNINFLSTAFDAKSLELLSEFSLDVYKIPSGEITNLPYLKSVAKLGLPIILSTGMSTMDEVKDAIDLLKGEGVSIEDLTVLHCNTEYPTPMRDVNLKAMHSIAQELGVKVGYSDHTLGIEVPIAAVAMGAVCIEKHFTLDRTMDGPDHKASLEPDELKLMVQSIRNIEKALGDGVKEPSASEIKNITVVRKSLHLAVDVSAGTVIQQTDLIALRPGTGISPMEIDSIIGKKTRCDLELGTQLKSDHFENA